VAGAVGAWLADRDRDRGRPAMRRRAVAVDGKTLAAPAHPCQATAARCTCWPAWTTLPARSWPNARSVARPRRSPPSPLLADLHLAGVVVTADALQAHPEATEFLVT
jgi:hypothetical protein